MRTGTRLAIVALVLATSGCASTAAPAEDREARVEAVGPTGPSSLAPVPLPSTAGPDPDAGPPPSPVPGPCPYLDVAMVQETVGQHIGSTTTTAGDPLPGCTFLRPDGQMAVDVSVLDAGDPENAVSVVDESDSQGAVAVAAGADGGVGDGGVVLVQPTGTLLSVSSGSVVVNVELNQASSLEAVALAREVVAALPG